MVRAKVYCDKIDGNTVEFSTVYEPPDERDTENQRFTTATPWGTIRMGIDNPAALAQFETGKTYYVDFHPAAK
jgi:hypothetical protein